MMRANTGTPPRAELVDITYRNGMIVRDVQPSKRRWTIADPKFGGPSDFDIVRWQRAKQA